MFGSAGMAKRLSRHLLAIALILAVGALGVHAVAHWHAHSYDDQHCQICHVGHAAVPQPVVQIGVQAPLPVARFTPTEDFSLDLEASFTLSIPRAPPA